MNDKTFLSFGDELTKIAFYQKLRNGFVDTLKKGWEGTAENKNTWMGKGPEIQPGMGRVGRTIEHFTGLGGLTKALPVGNKSMMLMGAALPAMAALHRQDPSGQQRSRTERMGAVAGNTVGGLLGAGLAARYAPKSWLGAMLGGIGGSMVGERLMTSPFRAAREQRLAQQQQMQQPQYYPPPEGAY